MTESERTARAALSRLFEPQDAAGLALVRIAGAEDALKIATGQLAAGAELEQEMFRLLDENGSGSGWTGLGTARQRWAPRVPDLAPARDLATMQRLGGRLIIPSDELWPRQLADLGLQEPICLWWRGIEQELPACREGPLRWLVPGTAPPTAPSVTGDLAYSLAQRGFTIISGGAYGIDAHAHRAALAGGSSGSMPTIAVMAGGVDRFYPSGNEELLRTVANQGAVLAEVPPGSAPTRYQVSAAQQADRRAGVGHGRRGSAVEVGRAEHGASCGNAGPGRRRGAGVGAQRQLRGLPPAAPGRRGGVRHRRRGDRGARLAQRRIAA